MSDMQKTTERERRQFFRIDDTLRVSLRRVLPEELDDRLDRLEQGIDGNFTVMASLAAITAQMAVHLRRIENDQPDVAAYLKGVDRKLEVLGRAFITQDPVLVSEEAKAVNLSAGGMCLEVSEPFEPNTPVEVRLLLFPSFTGILTYGDVVSCEPQPQPEGDGSGARHWRARVEFTHIREPDRDILIRHILRRQGDELRARRGEA
jgi:hypothetical protein